MPDTSPSPPLQAVSTRVFMNGNSHAVRIPQEFRLDCQQVQISLNAEGDLVLHPVPAVVANRGDALLQALDRFDPDFADALAAGRSQQAPTQEREHGLNTTAPLARNRPHCT